MGQLQKIPQNDQTSRTSSFRRQVLGSVEYLDLLVKLIPDAFYPVLVTLLPCSYERWL